MNEHEMSMQQLIAENKALKYRLAEAEQTIEAIRTGEVEALVVKGSGGDQVFTLEGADYPYRVLVERMNEGASTLAHDGSIMYCNNKLAALVGKPLEQVMGSTFRNFVVSEDQSVFDALFSKSFNSPCSTEIKIETGFGALIPVYISSQAVKVKNINVICMIITDLTTQKINAQINESQHLARYIVEQALEAIIFCDKNGVIIRANYLARHLCKINPVFTQFDESFVLQKFDDESYFSIREVLDNNIVENIDVCIGDPDNPSRLLLLNGRPLHNDDNKFIGCVVTLVDITERKKAEREREGLITELEKRNTELERFSYTVSHDLKSPLVTIEMYSEALKQKMEQKNYDNVLMFNSRIKHAAQKLRNLIEDLLALSRVGKQIGDREKIDFTELVYSVLDNVYASIEKHNMNIVVEKNMPHVYGDKLRLSEVMQNLIENAIKFSKDAENRTITIGHKISKKMVTIFVKDHGTGIDPSFHDKVFGIFYKLNSNSSGTGMGLAIVKRIIDTHNGKIWVESEGEGQGCTFCFSLPRRQYAGAEAKESV